MYARTVAPLSEYVNRAISRPPRRREIAGSSSKCVRTIEHTYFRVQFGLQTRIDLPFSMRYRNTHEMLRNNENAK